MWFKKLRLCKRFTSLFTSIFAIIIFSPAAYAAEYYVAPAGTAAWAECENIATPCSWRTAMSSAIAGDIVYFRGGTYDVGTIGSQRDYANMYPSNSGTSVSPITFKAYTGELPNITGTVNDATSTAAYFGCSYSDYITWDGFAATMQLYYYSSSPVTQVWGAWGSNYCVLKNSNFTGVGVGTRQYNTMLVRVEDSTYTTIENNYFHDLTGTTNNAINTAAIWLFDGGPTTIRKNTFNNTKGGVYAKAFISSADIYSNFFYNPDQCQDGINIIYQGSGTTAGFNIYQNVMIGCERSIRLVTSTSGTLDNAKIYNNSFYKDNDGDGIVIQNGVTNVEIYNNIISGSSPLLRVDLTSTYSYVDNNLFYHPSSTIWYENFTRNYSSLAAWTGATPFDTNSITLDPLFVNAGGGYPTDYILATGSPGEGTVGRNGNEIGAFPDGIRIDIGAKLPRPPANLQ